MRIVGLVVMTAFLFYLLGNAANMIGTVPECSSEIWTGWKTIQIGLTLLVPFLCGVAAGKDK